MSARLEKFLQFSGVVLICWAIASFIFFLSMHSIPRSLAWGFPGGLIIFIFLSMRWPFFYNLVPSNVWIRLGLLAACIASPLLFGGA